MKPTHLLAATLLVSAVAYAANPTTAIPEPADTTPYAVGMRALNQQHWPEAVSAFSRAAAARGKNTDAALYWKAYSLNKLNKPTLVTATCSQLHAAYSNSSWNRDCSALQLQLQLTQAGVPSSLDAQKMQAQAAQLMGSIDVQKIQAQVAELHLQSPNLHLDAAHDDPNSDIKLLALNSLMNRDPAQALPILRSLLAGNQPENVKNHALFVLAQNNSPDAQQLMHEIVLGHTDAPLQREAIQLLGTTQGKRANDTLEQLYRTTSDPQIRSAVLSALFVSGDASRMVQLAREEKDLDRKRAIVSQLALMQDKAATDYMLELLK